MGLLLTTFLTFIYSSFALPIITTDQGAFEGVEHGTYVEFRGIEYAVAGRWEEPREPEKHQGLFRADKFRDIAIQAGVSLKGLAGGKVIGSEKSHYMNIVVPKVRGKKNLPVLLWIHGGAYIMGSGAQEFGQRAIYDIAKLAREGKMIVVSINYRLGAMGYFSHEGLAKESKLGSTGNYGTLDKIEALKWIQKNIADFGGNPKNVTIMGESAGGNAVRVLLASPLAKGLFHKAIPLSGPDMELTKEESLQQTEEMRRALGIRKSAKALERLKQIEAERFINDFQMSLEVKPGEHTYRYGPTVDGVVLKDKPAQVIENGNHNKVDMMTIATAEEMESLKHAFASHLPNDISEKEFVDLFALLLSNEEAAKEALKFYKKMGDPINKATLMQALGDAMFLAPKQKISEDMVRHGNRVYKGLFSKEIGPLGKSHGADLVYAFGHQHFVSPLTYYSKIKKAKEKAKKKWGRFSFLATPFIMAHHMRPSTIWGHLYSEHKFAKQLRQYIYNFVHHGDPNITTSRAYKQPPRWPEYGSTGKYLDINHKTQASKGYREAYVDFFHDLSERYAARGTCRSLFAL